MVIIEALNAQKGDCLLLRYTGSDGNEKLWLIDGGPKSRKVGGKSQTVWQDVLLPRLKELSPDGPATVHLGMVSHIDDDHINGLQKITRKLVNAGPGDEKPVKFERFWFNSFPDIVGPAKPGAAPSAQPMAVAQEIAPELDGVDLPEDVEELLHQGQAVVQSVGQGNDLAADLGSLQLGDNQPVGGLVSARAGQGPFNILGAQVTVVGPRANRLERLREAWREAVEEAEAKKRKAKLQELFLPSSKLDDSVPNLSSIVVLVDLGGKRLLLTGDALGDDIVSAWKELGLGDGPVALDVLKMPHHGSIRNCSKPFLELFEATHYIFSADGQHDNPDGPTVEAVVKMHGKRDITLHFTNRDITWEKPHTTESGKPARTLDELIAQLRIDHPGRWQTNFRGPAALGVTLTLVP